MKEDDLKKSASFFAELAGRLRREDIQFIPSKENRLQITQEDCPICFVEPSGTVLARKSDLNTATSHELYHKVAYISTEIYGYMTLMENAPPLKAVSLSAPYRLLADFNGIVLGGMESGQGIQFTTWQRCPDSTGLTLGHYFGNNYTCAKQDFAFRAGLVMAERTFTDIQLAEIYRAIHQTLEEPGDMTPEREDVLKQAAGQIKHCLPMVASFDYQSNQMEMEQQM